MSDSLTLPSEHPNHLKTSLTHPINVSFIIPQELISIIASNACNVTFHHTPTILDIPPTFTLQRLLDIRDIRIQQQVQKLGLCPGPSIPQLGLITRSNISTALQNVISSAIDPLMDVFRTPSPSTSESFLLIDPPESALSLPISLSPQPLQDVHSMSPLSQDTQSPVIVLGNLLLSSCPGKKVRLTGPVKGRPGVCRDLELDLQRMRELGVRCVVCCLDDEELEFLGAPWPEYERFARNLGIDVLRVPIPEGLPPLTPSQIDAHIVDVLNRYTLRGVPILVHCRGGVGRAGVVACCWMIRLGLCGWLEKSPQPSEETITPAIDFVQKVIHIVRRRRSMKAIETYEQVLFLVEYVQYLRHIELRGHA